MKPNPWRHAQKPFAERFWIKVNLGEMNECWVWTAAKDTRGYGAIGAGNGKQAKAHRVAWQLTHGPDSIPEGMHVLHRCDNPPCVNPAHLFLGTHADNMADMVAKGRALYGGGPRVPRVRAITARQTQIFQFIKGFIDENGLSPTIREIGSHFGMTPRAAFDHVHALERKGYLDRYVGDARTARSLRIATGIRVPGSTNHKISTGS